ncbi:hypothetical protein PVAP13_2KG114064 [Panicum virgatum]|uniref:Uncharacterized protein n=1 Tax=Panicum virgatum TaxID=38727 RepID=A0A8T0VZW7_PANVG|nr:hypothetical protein PVAP13_2KG114064 [Panicum virgatum]
MNATVAAGKMENVAHGTPWSPAMGGSQWCAKSRMIQSGFLPCPSPDSPPAQAPARKAAKGAARPSKATLRSSTFSGGESAVDSAPSGRPSTRGRGSGARRMRGLTPGTTGLSLARFLGAETKVMKWPRLASCCESSRKGIMWPNASHGNTTTCMGEASSFLDSAMDGSLLLELELDRCHRECGHGSRCRWDSRTNNSRILLIISKVSGANHNFVKTRANHGKKVV